MLSNFSYIKLPDFTGNIIRDIQSLLYLNNKFKTYEHSESVANVNVKIAEQYGLDAEICRICGYLHDIGTVIAPDDMLEYAENNGLYIDSAETKYPFLLHQRMSRIIAEQDFTYFSDNRALSAIECHTTLKANPSDYDMALFTADKLSWDNGDLPPFYDIMKNSLGNSLEAASLAYMEYTVANKMILYPHRWFTESMSFLQNCN